MRAMGHYVPQALLASATCPTVLTGASAMRAKSHYVPQAVLASATCPTVNGALVLPAPRADFKTLMSRQSQH